jgi:hypothetical protein
MDSQSKGQENREPSLEAIAAKLALARKTAFTGRLTVTFDLNQGGVTGKKFTQEWSEK